MSHRCHFAAMQERMFWFEPAAELSLCPGHVRALLVTFGKMDTARAGKGNDASVFCIDEKGRACIRNADRAVDRSASGATENLLARIDPSGWASGRVSSRSEIEFFQSIGGDAFVRTRL